MLCRVCIVQIQPRKPVLDYADYTAATRQHAQDHTDQKSIFPERSITGVHINQDLLWCVTMGVYMGFWVHGGSWLIWFPVIDHEVGIDLQISWYINIRQFSLQLFQLMGGNTNKKYAIVYCRKSGWLSRPTWMTRLATKTSCTSSWQKETTE